MTKSIFSRTKKNLNDDIESKIDKLIQLMPSQINDPYLTSDGSTSKVIDSFLSKIPENEIEQLFKNISIPQERLIRYRTYYEMNRIVPIIKRIIRAYLSNILYKNPVDGKSIIYRTKSDIDKNENARKIEAKEYCKKIVKEFDIIKKLRKKILPTFLLYGDCFVEVVDIMNSKFKIPSTMPFIPMMESAIENYSQSIRTSSTFSKHHSINNNNDYLTKSKKITESSLDNVLKQISNVIVEFEKIDNINDEISSLNEEVEHFDNIDITNKIKHQYNHNEKYIDNEKINNVNFDMMLLKIHIPHNIIILQTKYDSVIGYLEVERNTNSNHNVVQSLTNVVGRLTSLTKTQDISTDELTQRLTFFILRTIIEKAKKENQDQNKNNQMFKNLSVDDLVKNFNEDVYYFVKRIFIEQGIDNKINKINPIKVRFISPTKMVSFSSPSNEHYPYGESVVENLILPCKLFMLSQLSNSITKLSRASLIRKWKVDVGGTQMQRPLIEKLKRELYNTRVTLNDLSSLKNIPKILSDFKDMFILTKQGQTPVDVEIESHGDPSIKVADLEDARKEIITLSGIPPQYLNSAETFELREQLVQTNVSFAITISDLQEEINESLNKLIDIISEMNGLEYKPTEYINVSLIPPSALILQLLETTLSSVGNIVNTFQQMNINVDPFYFLEQYVPHIDFDSFKLANEVSEDFKNVETEIEQKVKMNNDDNNMSGGGMY
jgi:hypothetical protein